MALFNPQTVIHLCATGIDTYNKPFQTSNASMAEWCISKAKHTLSQYSYQRADERQYCAVEVDYYECLACDTIVWRNSGHSPLYIIANITGCEWKNPNLTWVYFEVDAYATFCGNIKWDTSVCYVEREHVSNDWNGSNPNWDNIGVAESFSATPEVALYEGVKKYYTNFSYVVVSPYDRNGNPSFNATETISGVYSGMNMLTFQTTGQVDEYLSMIGGNEKADINNIVAILTVPSDFINYNTQTITYNMPWSTGFYGNINNAKCYSSQFCMIRVESMVGGHKDYEPELLNGTSTDELELFPRMGAGTVSLAVVPIYYAGLAGPFEKALVIEEVPQGAWVGNAYAQWLSNNGLAFWANNTMQAIQPVLGIAPSLVQADSISDVNPTRVAKAGLSVANTFIQASAALKNQKTNGVAMGGTTAGSPNSAALHRRYGVRVAPYGPTIPQMKAIDAYFDRFGYAVNTLKVPNTNTRPFWNYVKCAEAHVDGDMPANYRADIESMLNSGVTFWNPSRTIGDFSNAEGNKG